MLAAAFKQIKSALILLVIFSILTGLIYPAVVTLVAQLFFPWQANGSLIERDGKIIASTLIGQSFTDPRYFWSRPSATTPYPYNALNSSGSNYGPSNPDFLAAVKSRVAAMHKADPKNLYLIPVDLVTASASGLDPDISIWAAMYQARRIATLRGMNEKAIICMIITNINQRSLTLLGEPRVNVVQLNLKLDILNAKKDLEREAKTKPR